MVELEALGGVHRHHLYAARRSPVLGLLLAQPGLGNAADRAGELARGRLRGAARVRGGQLAELGEVHEALDDLGGGREQKLPAQPEPLDQAVHEEVRPARVKRGGGAAVELEEGHDPLARLGRDLRRLERCAERADHVELAPARDLGDARDVDRAQLDRRPRERAHDGARVAGVGEQAQPGQQVADLGTLEERRRAGEPVGDRALLERDGDGLPLASERSARARRHPRGRRLARLMRSTSAATAWACARSFAQRQKRTSPGVGRCRCAERLLEPVRLVGDDGVGGVQDRLPRAEAAVERDDRRTGELGPEVAQVLRRGAAEPVDRLIVVADRRHVAVLGDEQSQQQALREVRVLVLVDEHVPEAPGQPRAHVRLLAQQPERLQDEVAEVQRPRLGQHPVVRRVDVGELALRAARIRFASGRRAASPPTRRSRRA